MTGTKTTKDQSGDAILRLGACMASLLLLLAACSSSSTPLDAEVARQFDVADAAIADLSGGAAEAVPSESLLASAAAARAAGTNLRIIVTAPDGELIPAAAVVDRYGGTAISYQANQDGFEGASRDISAAQLDRAVSAARSQVDIGESTAAFVSVLESEGLEARGRSLARTALFLLLIPAALFMLSGAWSYFQARKRRMKRERDFLQRRTVLRDWAAQLAPEVDALAPATLNAEPGARRTLEEATTFVNSIGPKLDTARSLGELDAAEMRIGRVAIKLRELRRSLGV